MKFGISMEMVDLHRQEPNRNRRECKYYWDEIYGLVSAAGFDTIEIPYEPKWDFGGRSGVPLTLRSMTVKDGSVENYINRLHTLGIKSLNSVHLDPSLFFSANTAVYFGAFTHFATDAIDVVSRAGGDGVVLTPAPCIGDLAAECPKGEEFDAWCTRFLDETAAVINKLAEAAAQKNVTLYIKNEFWSPLRGENVLPFMQKLTDGVLLDADTANLKIAGIDPEKFISENIDRIGMVHFTDTSFVDDVECYKQRLPEFPAGKATQVFRDIGQGTIDFPPIVKALNQANYTGTVIYNCRQTRDVYRALLRTRAYINTRL